MPKSLIEIAEAPQVAKHPVDFVGLGDHQVFGQFQGEPLGAAARLLEDLRDKGRHIAPHEFDDRCVEGEAERRATPSIDLRRLRRDRAQAPGPDIQDRAGFLGNTDEPGGRLEAERAMVPVSRGRTSGA